MPYHELNIQSEGDTITIPVEFWWFTEATTDGVYVKPVDEKGTQIIGPWFKIEKEDNELIFISEQNNSGEVRSVYVELQRNNCFDGLKINQKY